ncbi:MAG: hypothetical protein PHT94_03075, partial [Candidatus Nanoarchaeia archaeon]|nr:hypothetical protein [Candidatus Nanoarchaeia archaeon]
MKNKLKIFMLFFITALLVYDVSGIIIGGKYYPDVSNVVVSLLNYGDNNELTPGTIEEFKIKIENIATVASEDVSIEIVNSFPIDPTKTGNEITEIGNLKAYQDGDEAVI